MAPPPPIPSSFHLDIQRLSPPTNLPNEKKPPFPLNLRLDSSLLDTPFTLLLKVLCIMHYSLPRITTTHYLPRSPTSTSRSPGERLRNFHKPRLNGPLCRPASVTLISSPGGREASRVRYLGLLCTAWVAAGEVTTWGRHR